MDNILGNRIGRGRLSSENHGNGTLRQIALLDLQILINGVKRIHLLALVFVETLHLDIVNGSFANLDSLGALQILL